MRKSYTEWKADQEAQDFHQREMNLRRRNRGNSFEQRVTPIQSIHSTGKSKTHLRLPLIFAIVLILTLAGFFGKQLLTEAQENNVDPIVAAKVEEKEREELLANPVGLPNQYIQLLSDNPDTLEFVKNYPHRENYLEKDFGFKVKKGEMPNYKQWDLRWGFSSYGNKEM